VEIPCSEKSAKSETSNFGLRFLRFFKCRFKKRKKSPFWIFKKKRKNVFSNYDRVQKFDPRPTLNCGDEVAGGQQAG